MILTCPECAAKYMVATDTIGEKGRDVRCAKCGHMWHQKSERDSLDELITRIQSEEMDDIAFGEISKSKNPAVPKPKESLGEIFSPITSGISYVLAKLKFKPQFHRHLTAKALKGVGAGVLFFLICAGLMIMARGPVTHFFPAMSAVFAAFGMDSHENKTMNEEDMLAFDHLSLDPEGHGDAVLSGTLINLTSSEVTVPQVMVEILGEGRKVLWSERLELAPHPLPAEDQLDFKVKLEKIPSEGGQRLELRFDKESHEGEDEASPPHSPAEEG